MSTAEHILVSYGVVSLSFGFVLGIPLSQVRMHAARAPRHLVTAHLSAIMQGAVHLGLSVAVSRSDAAAWLETTAATLLVAGSALFVAGACANWLQAVDDHFAVRSLGWKLLTASSFGHIPGMGILLVAVLASQ